MVSNIMLSVMALVSNTVGYAIAKIKEERGQDLLEYAVLAGAIAIVAGGALFAAGIDFTNFTDKIVDCINFNADDLCNDEVGP
jgi:Flp pilus assembly pilin Flp